MQNKRHRLATATLLGVAAFSNPTWAGTTEDVTVTPVQKPLWELGLATGLAHIPDYPGSGQTRTRGAVLPVLIYRGPVLRIEGGSIYGRVKQSTDWELDVSATGAFNASNNADRQGMADLDYLFGLGPELIYRGWKKQVGQPGLRIKLRSIMSTDLKRIDARGITFEPEVNWRFPRVAGTPATFSMSVQPSWGSRSLQRYFYQVNNQEATANRPAYEAQAGYMGTEFGITLSHRPRNDLNWFVAARMLSLHGSANRQSPLLRDTTNFSVGIGLVWTPWQSATMAAQQP